MQSQNKNGSETSSNALINIVLNQADLDTPTLFQKKISLLNKYYENCKLTQDLIQQYFILTVDGDINKGWSERLKDNEIQVSELSRTLDEHALKTDFVKYCGNDFHLLYVKVQALIVRIYYCSFQHQVDLSGGKNALDTFVNAGVGVFDYFDKKLKNSVADIILLQELFFVYEKLDENKNHDAVKDKLKLYRSSMYSAAKKYVTLYHDATDIILIHTLFPRLMEGIQEEFLKRNSGYISSVESFRNRCKAAIKNVPLYHVIVNNYLLSLNSILRLTSIKRGHWNYTDNISYILISCTQQKFNQYLVFEQGQIKDLVVPSIALYEKLFDSNALLNDKTSIISYKSALLDTAKYLTDYTVAIHTWLKLNQSMPDKHLAVVETELKFFTALMERMDSLINKFRNVSPWTKDACKLQASLSKATHSIFEEIKKIRSSNTEKAKAAEEFAKSLLQAENGKSRKKPRNRKLPRKEHLPVESVNPNISKISNIENEVRFNYAILLPALQRVNTLLQKKNSGDSFSATEREEIRGTICNIEVARKNFNRLCDNYNQVSNDCFALLSDVQKQEVNLVKLDFLKMKKESDGFFAKIAIKRELFILANMSGESNLKFYATPDDLKLFREFKLFPLLKKEEEKSLDTVLSVSLSNKK